MRTAKLVMRRAPLVHKRLLADAEPTFERPRQARRERHFMADSRLMQLAYVARLEGLGRPAARDPSRPFGPSVVNDRSQGVDTFE